MKKPLTFYAFWSIHLLSLLVFVFPFSWKLVVLCVVSFLIRSFGIGAGFHRYFAHRSYKTSRWFQFVLAFLGSSAMQSNLFWWAYEHRNHHRNPDKDGDPHSPQKGFFWAHMNWLWNSESQLPDAGLIKDISQQPELQFIDRHYLLPGALLSIALLCLGGMEAFVWGFCLPTVWLWHSTFLANSLGHVWGSRPYRTNDNSRNAWVLIFALADETWHNNHHRYPASARTGHVWWELDYNFAVLKVLSLVGIVWELKVPPKVVIDERH